MKNLILFLLLFPSLCFSQTDVNQDSLLFHFTTIINQYRVKNGLNKLVVDPKIKEVTDYWSKKMGESGVVGHGTGDNSFQNRIQKSKHLTSCELILENCTELMTPDKPIITDVKTYPELKPYIDGSYLKILTQYEYAMYGFLMWKNSPPHNQGMLDPTTKSFYISSFRRNGRTYLCYIAK